METTTKTAHTPRASDRVLQALATLAALLDRTINEVKDLDHDWQAQVTQAVHDSETLLKNQSSEHLRKAVAETEGRVRKEVSEDLGNKFQQELQFVLEASRGEFEAERERLNAAVNEGIETAGRLEDEKARLMLEIDQVKEEAALEIEKTRSLAAENSQRSVKEATAEADMRARKEITAELSKKYQQDLQRAADSWKVQLEAERERLNKELRGSAETQTKLEAERSRLAAEMHQIKEDSEKAIQEAREMAEAAAMSVASSVPSEIDDEITRVEAKIKEISTVIEDPSTELSL